MKHKTKIVLILILILITLRSFFWENIHTKALYDFDEARYAEVAKNVIKSNYLLIPMAGGPDDPGQIHLKQLENGNYLSPYFWKPPLHTLLIALFYKIIGINELAVRLPSLIFSLLSIILVFNIANILTKNNLIAISSIAIFSSLNDFSFISSQGNGDASLVFFQLLVVYFALKNKLLLSSIFFSFAFLTKSFANFWLLPLIIFIALSQKQKMSDIVCKFLIPTTIFVAPWHIYMYLNFGQSFIDTYFLQNTFNRGSGLTGNIAPFHWYLIYALDQWKSLLFITPILFATLLRKFLKNKNILLLITWIALIIIPFSISKTKVWWYVYPSLIPISILFSYLIIKSINNLSRLLIFFSLLFSILPFWQLSTHHIPLKSFSVYFLILFTTPLLLPKPKGKLPFLNIVIITLILVLNTRNTHLRSQQRTNANLNLKNLSNRHRNISDLSVHNIPYEAPLFYFDTGTIYRNQQTEYILSTSPQKLTGNYQIIDQENNLYLLKNNEVNCQ